MRKIYENEDGSSVYSFAGSYIIYFRADECLHDVAVPATVPLGALKAMVDDRKPTKKSKPKKKATDQVAVMIPEAVQEGLDAAGPADD